MGNILIEDMKNDEWLKTTEEKETEARLQYLKTFIKPLPNYCPECQGPLSSTIDEDETICTNCGLVTSGSIEYVSLTKIDYPYGRH